MPLFLMFCLSKMFKTKRHAQEIPLYDPLPSVKKIKAKKLTSPKKQDLINKKQREKDLIIQARNKQENKDMLTEESKQQLMQQTSLKENDLDKPINEIIKNIDAEIKLITQMNVETIENMIVSEVKAMDIKNALNLNVNNLKTIKADLSKMKEIQIDKASIEEIIQEMKAEFEANEQQQKEEFAKLLQAELNQNEISRETLNQIANEMKQQQINEFKAINDTFTNIQTQMENQYNEIINNLTKMPKEDAKQYLKEIETKIDNSLENLKSANNLKDLAIKIDGNDPLYKYISTNIEQLKNEIMTLNEKLDLSNVHTAEELEQKAPEEMLKALNQNSETIKEFIIEELNLFKEDINKALKTEEPIQALTDSQKYEAIETQLHQLNQIMKTLNNPAYPITYYITKHPALPEQTLMKIHDQISAPSSMQYEEVEQLVDDILKQDIQGQIDLRKVDNALKYLDSLLNSRQSKNIEAKIYDTGIELALKKGNSITNKSKFDFGYKFPKNIIKGIIDKHKLKSGSKKTISYSMNTEQETKQNSEGLIRESELTSIKRQLNEIKMILLKQHKIIETQKDKLQETEHKVETNKNDLLTQIKQFNKNNLKPSKPEDVTQSDTQKHPDTDSTLYQLNKAMEERRKDIAPDEVTEEDEEMWADGLKSAYLDLFTKA